MIDWILLYCIFMIAEEIGEEVPIPDMNVLRNTESMTIDGERNGPIWQITVAANTASLRRHVNGDKASLRAADRFVD